jgi:hypothetical protein
MLLCGDATRESRRNRTRSGSVAAGGVPAFLTSQAFHRIGADQ